MTTNEQRREPRLGIDIGRVIIDGSAHPEGGDTAFFTGDEATMLATPEMAGALESIGRLVDRFEGRVWLVSKCGRRVQQRTERWLDAHGFHDRTGLPDGQLRFCLTRPEKRGICDDLGLTHFVDDRADVHEAIQGSVQHQFFFGPQDNPVPHYGVHTPTWAVAEREILATLAR